MADGPHELIACQRRLCTHQCSVHDDFKRNQQLADWHILELEIAISNRQRCLSSAM